MIAQADIEKMTKEERLEAIHMLWDSMRECPADEPESPDWHEEVLVGRTRRIEAGEETFLTIEEAKAQSPNLRPGTGREKYCRHCHSEVRH